MTNTPHDPSPTNSGEETPAAPTDFTISTVNRVRRISDRARYDRETVWGILDRGLVAHVGFVSEGRPVVIPMAYGRLEDHLYLHSARKGRFATALAGHPVSVAVTLVDAIVVARSLFESSMNYRSVVVHGIAHEVLDDEDRITGLRAIADHNLPGRWDEVRAPFAQELKATVVLKVRIEEVSAKVRSGPPIDDYEEPDLSVWVGILPVITAIGQPIASESVPKEVPIPASVMRSSRA